MDFLGAPWILALAIFVARIVDVSLGTVRTILLFRGRRLLASTIGFFEILIWIGAISQVIQHLETWYLAVAYAAGFATGNAVGIWIEGKLAIGLELVRAISASPETAVADCLRSHGYSVLELDGHSAKAAPVEVLLVVEGRRGVPALLRRIQEADPDAICTISDVKEQRPTPAPGFRRAAGKRSRGGLFKLK